MHKEYILLNGFRKAKRGFTAGFHVPLKPVGTACVLARSSVFYYPVQQLDWYKQCSQGRQEARL